MAAAPWRGVAGHGGGRAGGRGRCRWRRPGSARLGAAAAAIMLGEPGLGRGAVSGRRGVGAGGSAPGGMFRKARRVNVRKRNDSEEEDEERDEEPPHDPPPPPGPAAEGPAEASAVAAAAVGGGGPGGPGLLPLPPGCVPLALPGSPAAFACAAGYGAALGLGLGLMAADRAGLGGPPPPSPLPPPPPPPPAAPQQGNGLPAAGRHKEKKRPREGKEVPRASLLSFQDEEEGEAAGGGEKRGKGPAASAPACPEPWC